MFIYSKLKERSGRKIKNFYMFFECQNIDCRYDLEFLCCRAYDLEGAGKPTCAGKGDFEGAEKSTCAGKGDLGAGGNKQN